MYIIFHEPAGKTIITDDRKEKFDVYNLKGMNIEYIDADVDQVFPSADNIIRVYTTPDVDKLKINYLADKPSIVIGFIYIICFRLFNKVYNIKLCGFSIIVVLFT